MGWRERERLRRLRSRAHAPSSPLLTHLHPACVPATRSRTTPQNRAASSRPCNSSSTPAKAPKGEPGAARARRGAGAASSPSPPTTTSEAAVRGRTATSSPWVMTRSRRSRVSTWKEKERRGREGGRGKRLALLLGALPLGGAAADLFPRALLSLFHSPPHLQHPVHGAPPLPAQGADDAGAPGRAGRARAGGGVGDAEKRERREVRKGVRP